VRAQAEECHGPLQLGPSFDRETPNQHETASRQHLRQHSLEARPKRGQWKVVPANGNDVNLGVGQPVDRALRGGFYLRDLRIRKVLDPVATCIQVRTVPGGRPLDFGWELIRYIRRHRWAPAPTTTASPATVRVQ
jgi:hypothetical protein